MGTSMSQNCEYDMFFIVRLSRMADDYFDTRTCWHSKHVLVDWGTVLGCHPFACCVHALSSQKTGQNDDVWCDISETCFDVQSYVDRIFLYVLGFFHEINNIRRHIRKAHFLRNIVNIHPVRSKSPDPPDHWLHAATSLTTWLSCWGCTTVSGHVFAIPVQM